MEEKKCLGFSTMQRPGSRKSVGNKECMGWNKASHPGNLCWTSMVDKSHASMSKIVGLVELVGKSAP